MFLRWWSLPQEFWRCDVSLYCCFFFFFSFLKTLSVFIHNILTGFTTCLSITEKEDSHRGRGRSVDVLLLNNVANVDFKHSFYQHKSQQRSQFDPVYDRQTQTLENSNFEGNCLKLKLNENKFNLSILRCPCLQHCNKIGSQHV